MSSQLYDDMSKEQSSILQ